MSELSGARRGVAVVFLVFGVFQGTWVSRIPSIQQHLDLGTGSLSIALLSAPVGQLVAAQVISPLVRRWSSAAVVRTAIVTSAVAVVLPGLAVGVASLAAALGVFGLSMGIFDIAMNSQAVVVERRRGRSLLSSLHGIFSVGTFAGAGGGAVAINLGVAPATHFALVGATFAALAQLGAWRLLPAEADLADPDAGAEPSEQDGAGRLLRHPFLLITGLIAFCALFAEGSVDNWSGVYLHDTLGGSLAVAPYGVAAAGATMAVGRFAGDRIIARWGHERTLTASTVLAAVGMLITVSAPDVTTAVAGYAVFGLGLSTIVPIAFTLAGNLRGVAPADGISRVVSLGFAGLFGAPPVVGLLAEVTGLRGALLVPAALVALMLPLTVAARRLRDPVPSP